MFALLEFVGTKRIPQWPQASFGQFSSDAWHHLGLHHHWRKEIRSISRNSAVETTLSHSDYRERATIDQDGLVQQVAICSESPLPVIEAEYRYRIRSRDRIVRLEQQSSQSWLHTKNIEVISGNNFH